MGIFMQQCLPHSPRGPGEPAQPAPLPSLRPMEQRIRLPNKQNIPRCFAHGRRAASTSASCLVSFSCCVFSSSPSPGAAAPLAAARQRIRRLPRQQPSRRGPESAVSPHCNLLAPLPFDSTVVVFPAPRRIPIAYATSAPRQLLRPPACIVLLRFFPRLHLHSRIAATRVGYARLALGLTGGSFSSSSR